MEFGREFSVISYEKICVKVLVKRTQNFSSIRLNTWCFTETTFQTLVFLNECIRNEQESELEEWKKMVKWKESTKI